MNSRAFLSHVLAGLSLRPLLLLLAVLTPAIASADSFEGKVNMTMTGADMKAPIEITYNVKGHMLRMDMAVPQKVTIIMDTEKREMTTLIYKNSMYMTSQLPTPADLPDTARTAAAKAKAEESAKNLVDTGEKTTILGYTATKYTTNANGTTTEMWLTDELGTFFGFGPNAAGGRRGGQSTVPSGLEALLKGKNFFPLRIVSIAGGKEKFRMETTAVDKGSVSDSQFQPPDGWKKFDMGSMGFPGMH